MPSNPSYEELKKRVQELEQIELERKKVEEDLAQIFSMSLDMICIADINTATFIKVNPAFKEILGYSEEALLEKPFFNFIHPEDIDATRAVIEQKLQMGAKVINFENRYRCKDGSYRWLSWVSHPDTEKGETFAVARDITESKQNEKELKKSKALLDATGRMAKVGGWELDAKTLEVTWTDETYRIHEVPLDYKPLLQEAIDFFHPDDREQLSQAIQQALDHGEPYDMEIRFITAKGKQLWTRTSCQPDIVEGKTVKLKGTFQDITEHKQIEDELKKSEQRFRQLFENMSSGVAIYESMENGEDFVFKGLNRAAEKIDQISKDEMIGKSVTNVFPGVIEFGLFDVLQRVWRTGVPEHHPISLYKDERIEGWRENYVYKLPSGEIVAIYDDITELKQTEEIIHEANLRQQQAIKAGNVGLWDWNLETNKVHYSKEWKRQIGYEDQEISDDLEEWRSRIHPDDLETILEEVQQCIAESRKDHKVEFRLRHRDGTYRWILAQASILQDATGRPFRMSGSHMDITEQKQAEEAIRQNESFLSSLLNAIPIPVFYKDIDGCYIGVNQSFEFFFGKSRDELIGKSVFDINPPHLADIYFAKDQELFRAGGKQIYESSVQNALGDRRDVIFSKAVFHDSKGRIIGLIGAILDITAMKLAEEEHLKSKEQLTSLVDNLIDSIVVTDQNGTIRFVNNAACQLFGRAKDALVGTTIGFPVSLEKMFEITTNPTDGNIRHAEAKTAVINWDGESSYLMSLRDITERKRAMDEREKMNTNLQQIEKIESIGKLAGGIAHDFNNMLSVILGYGEELLYALHTTDPLREFAKEIVAAGRRSAELTQQLLAFSRRQTLQPEVLDLNVIVRNIENVLRRLIGEDIELRTLLAEELAPVEVDQGQIEQVIVNLAVNARDAMPQGGKLTIETANMEIDEQYADNHISVTPGEYVMLAITDNGCGMDENTRAKVFEPFFTTKKAGKGTGLGLSTVYGIVKQLGGNIWVYSEPDQGTTFKIYLPQTTKALFREKAPRGEDSIEGHGEMVLLVEDEPTLRKLCEKFLKLLNYSVTMAANGGEALLLVEEKKLCPDLIITDVVMPEMSGKVLVDRLKKSLPDLKVIYMSGYTDNAIVHHGVLDPGTPFIQKPFTKDKLGKAIRSFLNEA